MTLRTGQQPETAASEIAVETYTNRMGETYYLHEGKTKTGKVRYFVAKAIREGVLSVMPNGFEFSESINGVVSVRRTDLSAARIPETDLALARAEMAHHAHLRHHRVEVIKGEIVVFQPANAISADAEADRNRPFIVRPERRDTRGDRMRRRVRYAPVMKFVPFSERGVYSVYRMTYRGDGGWSWPLASGSLNRLLKRYLSDVGGDQFFELF
jgi:hypothetical protein